MRASSLEKQSRIVVEATPIQLQAPLNLRGRCIIVAITQLINVPNAIFKELRISQLST